MQVRVERCWCGGEKFTFRLTMPDGSREFVPGETWTRATAAEALNLLEHVYHVPRRTVRFTHR